MIACPKCGSSISQPELAANRPVVCVCGHKTGVAVENHTVSMKADIIDQELSELVLGESVKIVNAQHPCYGEIALICGKKHKMVRIEIHGYKYWVPNDWVEQYV